MRLTGWKPAVLAAVCSAALFACAQASDPESCQHNFDCPTGQACVDGRCAAVPCGGCQPDEACGNDGQCVAAAGASCASHTCPAAYPCNPGGVCARPCTLNQDCESGFVCNSALKSCAECTFDTQCEKKPGKPVCDTGTGSCVACNANFDCVKAVGTGHFCDAHQCKPGCKGNADCNATIGETCDTSTNPGKCVQCHTSADCAVQGPSASACDDTGHCVQCWGATQLEASKDFCSAGQGECNMATKSCVQCLPANNQSGLDCGYLNGGQMDPHDARTCDPSTLSCTNGCEVDAQCGCPRNGPGGTESGCPRWPDQEHCDPKRTTMAGVSGGTIGACVQCTTNAHCSYRVAGSPLPDYPPARAKLNGARCVGDSCVEGCDADADCWPDRVHANGKICHVGNPGDPNNHKCVECHCSTLSADGTYCEDDPVCSNAGKVCDRDTLACRKKRQSEMCSASSECGDAHDPTIGLCIATPSICVYHSHSGVTTGGDTYCAAGAAFGRCGVPCNDFQDNFCVASEGCPTGTHCRQATGEDLQHVGSICVSDSCNH